VTLQQEIVNVMAEEVVKIGTKEAVQENAIEVIEFMKSFRTDLATAIITLDYALNLLCVWAIENGVVVRRPEGVN